MIHWFWPPNTTANQKYKIEVLKCFRYGELLVPYYNQLAEAARASGLLAFGHDHVGHGKSEGERVQVSLCLIKTLMCQHFSSVQISDYEDYTEPLLTHCREMKEKHPSLPLFLVGHSLGGLISLLSVLEAQVLVIYHRNNKPGGRQHDFHFQDLFAGLVLVGPLIHLDPKMAGCFLVNPHNCNNSREKWKMFCCRKVWLQCWAKCGQASLSLGLMSNWWAADREQIQRHSSSRQRKQTQTQQETVKYVKFLWPFHKRMIGIPSHSRCENIFWTLSLN